MRDPATSTRPPVDRSLLLAVPAFALFGLLWILSSDHLLALWLDDPARLTDLQTAKGVAFVALTCGLIGWLAGEAIRREARAREEALGHEAESRALFHDHPLPSWICDASGGAVLDCNRAALPYGGMAGAPTVRSAEASGSVARLRRGEGEVELELSVSASERGGRPVWLVQGRDLTSQRRAEAALRAGEARWRLALRATGIGMWDYRVGSERVEVSEAYASMLGFDPDFFVETGARWASALHPADRDGAVGRFRAYVAGQLPDYRAEFRLLGRDGNYRWIRSTAEVMERETDGRPSRVIGTHLDVTAEHAAAERIAVLTRFYDVLRLANQAIARAPDRTGLLAEVCRIVVDHGGLRMVWLGARADADGRLLPLASHGDQGGFLDAVVSLARHLTRDARGPSERALDSGEVVIVDDYFADPHTRPWREAALAAGIRAAAAFPLESGPDGSVLTVYADAVGFFTAERVELLRRLTDDLRLALARMTLEAQHRRSERVLRELIQATPDWIFALDGNGRFLLANPAVAQALGADADALAGRLPAEVLPELAARPDLAQLFADEPEFAEGGTVHQPIVALNLPDGRAMMFDLLKAPLHDESGQAAGLLGYARDITDSMAAYRHVSDSEARLKLYMERLPIGCAVFDAGWTLLEANPAFDAIFGHRSGALVGRVAAAALFPPRATAQLDLLRARLCEGALDARHVMEGLTRDGREILCDWLFTPLADADGNIRRFLAMVTDISARVEADAALAENHQRLALLSARLLEVQEAERRALARELHDQIGQQLAAIKLNLHALANTPPHDKAGRDRLDDCRAIVEHTIVQIRDRALDLRPSLLDDLGLVPALDWYCRRQAQRAGVAVELQAPALARLPDMVETTAFRIVQEAVNNALRHGAPGRVAVSLTRDGDHLVLEVRDDGRGFDPDAQVPGEAFGLSGMRERVTLAGGDLVLESRSGGGTRIQARLPIPPEDDEVPA